MKPHRVPLYGFPDVVMLAEELAVKQHGYYHAAKSGDADAADLLISNIITRDCTAKIKPLIGNVKAQLMPVHALESHGINEIPAALARMLSLWHDMKIVDSVVQSNTVGHTGASGFQRLANQALFTGGVEPGHQYVLVDDFVGQGGTLANLLGYVYSQGARVIGVVVLTGKPYSAKLAPDESQIHTLREKHGRELEDWWQQTFGFGFDCLTRSEARYLENSPDAQTIRDRLVAARLESSIESTDAQ